MLLIVALALLIALPGLAIGLNHLIRYTIHQAVETQQQVEHFESRQQHRQAEPPGD
jgi:hypothetical protein